MMTEVKILYSLGCTCDPHMTWQRSFKEETAPSIFAGLIQLQEESNVFIPQFLFDGTLEKYFFNKHEWKILEMIDVPGFQKSSLFRDPISGDVFQYRYNLQNRVFLDRNKIDLTRAKVTNPCVYYSQNLHLLNIHANEKPLGVNPMNVEYQEKKYEFFLSNKHRLKFGIYLHRSVTEKQLIAFQEFFEARGYDCNSVVAFIRNNNEKFEEINFKKTFLKYSEHEQINQYYASQQNQIINLTKQILI